MEPTVIEYQELKQITDGFSENRKIGEGGYGKVYWGLRENGDEIAVKMLRDNIRLDDKQFQNEFGHHFELKHDNIVRLVGFCHESKGDAIMHQGNFVLAEKRYRALCFEYMNNGSLQKYISDECDKLDWHTSYKIIKGTCEGLKYLHERSKPILHLDLKPDNILLDKNMVPKLADFGLSKDFQDRKTRTTKTVVGTHGYMPPEFLKENTFSDKNDIFSLGVIIIEIMMGPAGYSQFKGMSSVSSERSDKGMSFGKDDKKELFIDLVQEKWRRKLQATHSDSFLEEYCKQIKICTDIAIDCVNDDKEKRPRIVEIIKRLNEAGPTIDQENNIIVPTYGLTAHTTHDIVSLPVVKLRMWSGNEGRYHDLSVMPRRLLTMTVRCGEAIDSIEFSYIGVDLKEHVSGRWGGTYGEAPRKIILGPDEIVQEISGTYADYRRERDVIRSLTIFTNFDKEHSFGEPIGNHFRIPVDNNGHIVGFYARSKQFLNAIGIYVHP